MRGMLLILFCLTGEMVFAQDSSRHTFTLGEVVVNSAPTTISTSISAPQIQVFAKNNVSQILDVLPGITVSNVGPRNEAMVYLRGFDLRQVPLLIDGIPVYVPYDGYIDLARFTTFDLAEVNVSKGYTSVIYGPNALGGAINLITRRPQKKLEFNGASGWQSGGYRTNINVGSNLGKFYIQVGASKLKRDSFPLSHHFVPTKTERGGWRDNSYNTDEKYNFRIGFTPNQRSEYALSYSYQHGTKGTPVYAGSDTLNSLYKSPRYWQWPYYNKQSLYFISNTTIDSSQYVKTRLYWDQFRNLLDSYDDGTYTKISRPYAFKSYYDDYTLGGIVEYGKSFWHGREQLKGTVQYKEDVHREHNEGEPVRNITDETFTAGVENNLQLLHQLLLRTGVSFNNRQSTKAQDYNSTTKTISNFPPSNNNAVNVQGALEYHLTPVNLFTFSVARKTRFATVKDRYSYRFGTALPNPDLKAEDAVNYDLSYRGAVTSRLNVTASLFYSKINNTILSVNNVKYDSTTNMWLSQMQNVGKSEYMGAEAGIDYMFFYQLHEGFSNQLHGGINYTYIKRNNLTQPALHFTDVPNHKVFAYLEYTLRDLLILQANTEYNSKRYSTTYGASTAPFTLLNATATVKVWKYFSVEAGVNNITDKNYSLTEGYPEPGRNYFANVIYRL